MNDQEIEVENLVDDFSDEIIKEAKRLGLSPAEIADRIKVEIAARDEDG